MPTAPLNMNICRNVHKVYYWATTPKHFLYIYTEECDHNLQDLIDCDWFALTLNGIRSIAIQTCEGLNFLHSRNFVHGNVNCRSILVKWNRGMKRIGKIENAEVKLAYCNLDRFVRKRDSAVKINRFDAPEIAAAKFGRMKDFRQTKESDIFSLGVALHVAAEKGKFPFTIKELLQRGLSPTTENRRGKDSIFGVIFSMLSWKAEERPKAAEAAQDFLLGVIQIRRMSGETYPLLVRLRDSVGETKRKIEKEEKFLLASVRIVFAGIELQNEDEKLCNCGINFEDIIDIIVV